MNNVIMVRINGMIKSEDQRKYREQLLKDIKEGLFVVDDAIKDVVTITINDLGIEEANNGN